MIRPDIESGLTPGMVERLEVEEFLFAEAGLLDNWQLNEWFALFTEDCLYEVAPTGLADPFSLSPMESFFYVSDDWARLEQRVLRLQRPSAHVEYPHSRTRHLYSNVRVIAREEPDVLVAMANFATYRTKNRRTLVYPGAMRFVLRRTEQGFRIVSKRVAFDLDALIPQGKVSIIF